MGEYNTSECVIFDLDGTLAHVHHRRGYLVDPVSKLPTQKFDWKTFLDPERVAQDTLNVPVYKMLMALYNQSWPVVICSGRPDTLRDVTETWLRRYGVSYHHLLMRKGGDYRSDVEVKAEMLAHIRGDLKLKPVCAFDDRDKVVKMWRQFFVPCFQVAEGKF